MNGRVYRSIIVFVIGLCFAAALWNGSAPSVKAQTRLASAPPPSVQPPSVQPPPSAPQAVAVLPPAAPDAALIEAGDGKLATGDLAGAIKAFSTAAAEAPRSPAAYHLLALAYLHAGRYSQAAQAAQSALNDCPATAAGHGANAVLLGRALYGLYRAKLDAWNERYAALPGARVLLSQMSHHQWEDPSGVIITEQTDVDAAPIFNGMRDSIISDMYAMRRILNQAELSYRDAISLNAGEPGAHDGLGLVLAAADDSTQARREIVREEEIQGPSAQVYQHLGELDMEDQDTASAIDNLRRALAMSPRTILIYDDLAKVYARRHDDSGTAWASGMSLLLRGKTDDARRLFDKAAPTCDIRRAQAMLCLMQRQEDQARALLNDALKSAPQDPRTLTMLADVETSANRLDAALTAYQQAITSDPESDSAWYGIGLVNDKLGKPTEAIAAYAKSLSLNPNNSLARLNLAADEVDAGQKQEAVRDLREYLKRFPFTPETVDVKSILAQTEGSL